MKKITALIVDDEPHARKRIHRLLENRTEFSVIAQCGNGQDVLKTVAHTEIDLIFLDIQMPGMNGFELLQKIDPDRIPFIIFVTAYDQYALRAFEVHAIDYLLKPFDDDRFYCALDFAENQIRHSLHHSLKNKLAGLVQEFTGLITAQSEVKTTFQPYISRITVKTRERIYFLKTDEVIRIKSAGKNLEILVGNSEHLIRQTMNEVERKLDPNRFLRIHRSVIINLDEIKEIQHWYKNEYIFILKNGEKFTSGGSYRKNLNHILAHFS